MEWWAAEMRFPICSGRQRSSQQPAADCHSIHFHSPYHQRWPRCRLPTQVKRGGSPLLLHTTPLAEARRPVHRLGSPSP
uniref:Uncharacterized protein n=1 Tax=Setaria italica TaxID=4555 RepID=A0A0Q3QQG3_SETIT